MKTDDFIFLNVPGLLEVKETPPTGSVRRLCLAYAQTAIEFLKEAGFLKPSASGFTSKLEATVIRMSDLTIEGQDFLMSGRIGKWLGACDRKSSRMRAAGASEDEGLAVYRDKSRLFKLLEEFRKTRRQAAN